METIVTGSRVVVVKGCKARGVVKGTSATVTVTPLGAEYGWQVDVALKFINGFQHGKTLRFSARHINRLSDGLVNLHDGNPLHRIQIKVRS